MGRADGMMHYPTVNRWNAVLEALETEYETLLWRSRRWREGGMPAMLYRIPAIAMSWGLL
jgi:hypothetical protein